MGLLDDFSQFVKTPEGMGLLSAVAGGLAGAQRGAPINSLGRAGLAGVMGYGNALDRQERTAENALQNQFRTMQMGNLTRQQEEAAKRQANIEAYAQTLNPDERQRFMLDPSAYIKDITESKVVAPGAALVRGGQSVFSQPKEQKFGQVDVPMPGGMWQMYEEVDGKPNMNKPIGSPFAKRATATSVEVAPKIDIKTGESVAAQVGPMLKESRGQAMSGIRLVDSAGRILDAAEKGNLFAGPGANLFLKGAQVADVLGIGGKDTKEKITNTRTVVRGMAEQAVQARSQLGGQAQISNSEQELLNKATSGDIGELTAGEIIQIAELNDRLGRMLHSSHTSQLENMTDPGLQGLRKFYAVPDMPPARAKLGNQGSVIEQADRIIKGK